MTRRSISLADFVGLKRGYDLPSQQRGEGSVPILGSFGITGTHDEPKHPGPGVSIGRSGASIGVATYCPDPYWPLNTTLYVNDFKGNNPRFVYYILDALDFADYNSGSAQPSLNRNYLASIPIPEFDISEQATIVAILGSIDDLIENNRRRIEVLEEMAQAIYREWFVHFRFPGHEDTAFVDSPLGTIPEDWEIDTVEAQVKRLRAGTTYQAKDLGGPGIIPVIDQSRDALLGFHNAEPAHVASPTNPIAIFGDHTCKLQLLIEPFSVGPNVVTFVSSTERGLCYLTHSLRGAVTTTEYKRHWSTLMAVERPWARPGLTQAFDRTVMPLMEQAELLRRSSRTLRGIRDTLVPKLITGEIMVSGLDLDARVGMAS